MEDPWQLPLFVKVMMYVMYISISLAAIGGNGIVVYTVFFYQRMRTVTNFFIVNLAIGDLLMAMLCIPFGFISNLLLQHWPFGATMCVVVSYSQAVSVFISAYTLLAISIDRYIAILFPLKPRMTKFQAKCIIGLIWSFALLTPLPTALLSRLIPKQQVIYLHSTDSDVLFASANLSTVTIGIESVGDAVDSESADNRSKAHSPNQNDSNQATQTPIDLAGNSSSLATLFSHTPLDLQPLPELYSCVEQWNNPDHRYLYSMLLMALQYMLPIVVLIYTYSRIAFVVWIKKTPGEAQDGRDRRMAGSKRRMVKMMIIVVSVYTLCWLPLNTLIVIADLNEGIWQINYIIYVWFLAHWLAMSHSAYNPIIYCWMNNRFRNGFKQIYIGFLCLCGFRSKSKCRTSADPKSGGCLTRGHSNSMYATQHTLPVSIHGRPTDRSQTNGSRSTVFQNVNDVKRTVTTRLLSPNTILLHECGSGQSSRSSTCTSPDSNNNLSTHVIDHHSTVFYHRHDHLCDRQIDVESFQGSRESRPSAFEQNNKEQVFRSKSDLKMKNEMGQLDKCRLPETQSVGGFVLETDDALTDEQLDERFAVGLSDSSAQTARSLLNAMSNSSNSLDRTQNEIVLPLMPTQTLKRLPDLHIKTANLTTKSPFKTYDND